MVGCSPQEIPVVDEPVPRAVETVHVSEQGWLVFSSQDHFSRTFKSLFKDLPTLESFDVTHGYTSFFNAWRSISEKEYEALVPKILAGESLGELSHMIFFSPNSNRELEEQTHIDQPILQFLANEKGLLQVGDSLKKYTYDWVVSVPVNDLSLVDKLQTSTDFSSASWEPYKIAIRRSQMQEPVQHLRAGTNVASAQYKPGRRNMRRVYGETNFVSSGQFDLVLSRTRHQRRISGIWFGDNAPTLIHEHVGSVDWDEGNQVDDVDFEITLPNESSTPSYTISLCDTWVDDCEQTDCEIDSFHGCGVCDNGATNRNCTTDFEFDD